jgi:hypothetical protein
VDINGNEEWNFRQAKISFFIFLGLFGAGNDLLGDIAGDDVIAQNFQLE